MSGLGNIPILPGFTTRQAVLDGAVLPLRTVLYGLVSGERRPEALQGKRRNTYLLGDLTLNPRLCWTWIFAPLHLLFLSDSLGRRERLPDRPVASTPEAPASTIDAFASTKSSLFVPRVEVMEAVEANPLTPVSVVATKEMPELSCS